MWLAVLALLGAGCAAEERRAGPAAGADLPPLPGQSTGVFTTARPSVLEAAREQFGIYPAPDQPLEFPHDVHVNRGITCTSVCHAGAEQGAIAGLPGITTCMTCHSSVAADRQSIRQLAALQAQGIDLNWERVTAFPASAHVRFVHAPHLRTGITCATCHGDVASQTVPRRNPDLNMGFCVTCHLERGAPDDCLTCHS